MSQSNQYSRQRGEADRFDRDNYLPVDEKLYLSRRQKRYPDLDPKQLPLECRGFKDIYKNRQYANDDARRIYSDTLRSEKQIVTARPELERDYYDAHSQRILPSGHRRLEPLAAAIGETEWRHARAREDALRQFPLMDTDLRSKRKHFAWAREHYIASDEAYKAEEDHASYRAAIPPTGALDLYGNEPRRGHQAYDEPFPPHYPPSGYYSTNRGDEPIPGGGGFTPVSSSKKKNRRFMP